MSVKNNDLTGVKQVKNEGERVINCELDRLRIGSENGSQPGVKSGVIAADNPLPCASLALALPAWTDGLIYDLLVL